MIKKIKNFCRFAARRLLPCKPDPFFDEITGVIHVGANFGQERKLYAKRNLNVIWIEPIPSVFKKLESNIKDFPNQKALQALVTDQEGKEYEFNIANNSGASSSILKFKHHSDIWPAVKFDETIMLKSKTLSSIVADEKIDLADYSSLVIDTQGAELLVLKGGKDLLKKFKYIQTEVADFEPYEGSCQLPELSDFLKKHGFHETSRKIFAERNQGGTYYDVVFKNSVIPCP